MGKTRVAMAAILAVLKSGGTAAAVVPPGLLKQWKKEWAEFNQSLPGSKAEISENAPIPLRSYYAMFEQPDLCFPLSEENDGKWLLISHLFGVPGFTAGEYRSTPPHRYMLPILATALRLKNDGENQGNLFRQFIKELNWDADCIEGSCDNCNDFRQRICRFDIQARKAAEYLSNHRWRKYRNLPDIRLVESAKEFFNSSDGFEMIGDLLGHVDLLVIDEAHKSRDTEEDQTRLGSLLRNIIRTSHLSKRIALTATPMELRSSQWETVFHRIGEGSAFPILKVQEFATAHDRARKQPDSREIIIELINKSRAFSLAMRDFITRRRRTQQTGFINLVGIGPCTDSPHPHREWTANEIRFLDVSKQWRPAVFAMEALGKAAKGLAVEDNDAELKGLLKKAKLLDSRYAAGQIGTALDYSPAEEDMKDIETRQDDFKLLAERIEKHLGNTEAADEYSSAKMRRVAHWLKQVVNVPAGNLDGHPRIQYTADLIEGFVWGQNGDRQEKVLAFGTYVAPLKALRDVLNRRAALRLLNRTTIDGSVYPLPGAKAYLRDLNKLVNEYQRMCMRSDSGIDLLKSRLASTSLEKLISKAARSYDRQQERLRTLVDARVFVGTLPGDCAIKEARLSSDVAGFLRAELLNRSICTGTDIGVDSQEIRMRALLIWVDFLSSFLDTEAKDGKADRTEWHIPEYFKDGRISVDDLHDIDHLADNMKSQLSAPLIAELNETSNRFGSFARLLYSDVKMESRHILQAQFNNEHSFPMVLIAQSQVGREGLNLHEACRIVVQFHSEWNPGVVEQQIGRVDRIHSFWEKKAHEWKRLNQNDRNGAEKECVESSEYHGPKIKIRPVVFGGTYDAFQYAVSKRRRETLKAHLFGELLDEATLEKMPKDGEWVKIRNALKAAAPDFSPPKV